MQADTKAEKALQVINEILGVAVVSYMVWLYLPETWKAEMRAAFGAVRVPFEVAAANRRAHKEMWLDMIDLATFGVPADWARST